MADTDTDLPEGTDTIINGAATVDTQAIDEAGGSGSNRPAIGGGAADSGSEGGIADRIRSGRDRITSQAGDRARGLVTQGLEKSAEALAGVGRMVGDTAAGIDERLGSDYGDYARRAASAIESASNSIASKDPDELIDDAREFVRNSPGIALAGAAVVGFVLARVVRSGLAATRNGDDDRD